MAKPRRRIGEEKRTKRGTKPITLNLTKAADTAVRLLQELSDGVRDPSDLTAAQRRACLMVAADGRRPSHELAALFKVTAGTIRKDMAVIRKEVGTEVGTWGIEEVVGDLALAKERCVAMAMAQEDPGLVWTIHREFAKSLVEFGVVERKSDRSGFEISIRAVGDRYPEAVAALAGKLDPAHTGMIGQGGGGLKGLKKVVPHAPSEEPAEPVTRQGVDPSDWPDLEP